MDAGDVLQLIFFGFLTYSIQILFWIGTLIFGIVMLRRSGGKAERFFITGAALNILGTILRIPLRYVPIWLYREEYEIDMVDSTTFGVGLFIDIIAALGVICLLYSFWLKFNSHRIDQSVSAEAE